MNAQPLNPITRIVVLGATGLVGRTMLSELEAFGYGDSSRFEVIPAASPRSAGSHVDFAGRQLTVVLPEEAIARQPHFALFSAGASASRQYAPLFADAGCRVVDNSSAWRMDPSVPLVVPEINPSAISPSHRIIANPNCSTIQMVLALSRMHKAYRLRRIVVATYQSVSGSGKKGIDALAREEQASQPISDPFYRYPIHRNVLPECGDPLDNGYTTEEQKLLDETRKIFNDSAIEVSATAVRVPVTGGHSEAVNAEFFNDFSLKDAELAIAATPGVILLNNLQKGIYPIAPIAQGTRDVYVGRLRLDPCRPRTLNLWVVADNLFKGAASNAVQILNLLTAAK